MEPTRPALIYSGPIDMAAQLRRQDTALRLLGRSVGLFLAKAFPTAAVEGERVGMAFIEVMCAGTEEQLKMIEAQAKQYRNFAPPDGTQRMAYLVGERDKIQEQLDQAVVAKEKLEDNMPVEGYGDLMEATMVLPIRQRLKDIEVQISECQSALENH